MCGIFGYIGKKKAMPILLDALSDLEYRGYDSAGIAILDTEINVTKCVGKVDALLNKINIKSSGNIGIAHTRWATHGGVTERNAHPHLSEDNEVAIVHNGIIDNANRIRNKLREEGINVKSETDTEVIVHLINKFLKNGLTNLQAVEETLKLLQGTWGICVLFQKGEMICARNGSPLLMGIGENEFYISSDPHAIEKYTNKVIYLEDGDIIKINHKDYEIKRIDGKKSTNKIINIEFKWGDSELGDYPHYMMKEIHDQPSALRNCITGRVVPELGNCRLSGLSISKAQIENISYIRLIGCGTSHNAAQIGGMIIESIAKIPALSHVASEFDQNDMIIDKNALYFALSQSGETADTLSCVKNIQTEQGTVLGIVNVVGSSIARQCGRGAYIHAGPEKSVASTKVFTNMVAALTIFAVQIGRSRNLNLKEGQKILKKLLEIPDKIQDYLENPINVKEAASLIKNAKNILFIGRGVSYPVAREGALKLMELAYIPCLSYPGGELKHGPLALLENNSIVVAIVPSDKHRNKMISNIQQCKARGAIVIIIHEKEDVDILEYSDLSIPIPTTLDILSPLLSVIPLQLLSYYTALELNRDIDRPRNLAKSVTVS